MEKKLSLIIFLFGACSSIVITRFRSPEELKETYRKFQYEGTRLKTAVLQMNEFQRMLLCTHVLTEQPDKYGFLYSGSDSKNVTIHAAIQMAVLPSFQIEVPMVACFGPNSRSGEFKEFFIAGGLKNDTYFLFEKNSSRTVTPFGLIELEPTFFHSADQNHLEKHHLHHIQKLNHHNTNPTKDNNTRRSELASNKQQPASNVDSITEKALPTIPVTLSSNESTSLNWSPDTLIITCPICVPPSEKKPPAPIEKQIKNIVRKKK